MLAKCLILMEEQYEVNQPIKYQKAGHLHKFLSETVRPYAKKKKHTVGQTAR